MSVATQSKTRRITQQIASFRNRFGEAHLYFAYHAALPLALTPDLLYRLWANFQRNIHGEILNVPWIAVADLLLSSLCNEVGNELYEMDAAVRNQFLNELKTDPNFGQQRITELSEFVLSYVQNQINSADPDIRDFAQTQRWTALAYTQPDQVCRELALAISRADQSDRPDILRLASLVETLTEPLSEYEQFQWLLTYALGMASLTRGHLEDATAQFKKLQDTDKHPPNDQVLLQNLPLEVKNPLPNQAADNSNSANQNRNFRVLLIVVLLASLGGLLAMLSNSVQLTSLLSRFISINPTPTPTTSPTPKPRATPRTSPTPKPRTTPRTSPTPKPRTTPTTSPTPKPRTTPRTSPTPKPRTTPPTSARVEGIDVSEQNGNIDWEKVKNQGIRFAFARVNDGTTLDKLFPAYWTGMKKAGIIRGAYFFFRPTQDIDAQVKIFAQSVNIEAGDLPPAVEIDEVTNGLSSTDMVDRVAKCLKAVEVATGYSYKPIIYTSPRFWREAMGNTKLFADYPLWIGNYQTNTPSIPGGWKTYLFHQYTGDTTGFSGVQGSVYRNRYYGTLDDLRKLK